MSSFIYSKIEKWVSTHLHTIHKLLSRVLVFNITLLLHFFLSIIARVFKKKPKLEQISLEDYLAAELLTHILTRLPIKTLLRCTSVSKSWYSLITSPNFITTHLNNRTNSRNQARLLVVRLCNILHRYSPKYLRKERYSLCFDNDTFDEFATLDFPLITSKVGNQYFRIVGMCNGLVCLSGDKLNIDFMALWNPSLKKSLILPKPNILRRSPGPIRIVIRPCIGFGINTVSNEYKIVRLTYLCSDRVLEQFTPPEVEVFKLSTSSWRNINVGDFPFVTDSDAQQAFLNGVVHWAGYNPEYNSNKAGSSFCTLIVSFDMRNDTLGFVMAPACVQQHWDWSMCVTIFGESLSFSHFDVDNHWCIWVMKEYGVEGSWRRQFNIDLGGNFGRPVCFKENGDIILERSRRFYGGSQLVSYDPKSKLIKNLNICGMASSFYVDTYNESLVLTKGLNEVLGRQENSGVAVTCRGTSVLPREEDEVKGRRNILREE